MRQKEPKEPPSLCSDFFFFLIYLLGFTPCKAGQPLRGMVLPEKKSKKGLQATENLFRKNLRLKNVC